MKKNIIFIYGENTARKNYFQYLLKRDKSENVYMLIDDLNMAINILPNPERNRNQAGRIMRNFISFMNQKSKSEFTSNDFYYLYKKVSGYMQGRACKLEIDACRYIYENWISFILKNKDRLSFHSTLMKKAKKYNVELNNEEGLGIKFINKNITMNSIDINEEIKFDCFGISIIKRIFSEFYKGDTEGLNALIKIEEGVEERDFEFLNKAQYILLVSFSVAIVRKLCKLGLEWVTKESRNPNSPIKGFCFIEDYFAMQLSRDHQVNRYHARLGEYTRQHHPWREEKSFESGKYCSSITESEFRYLNKTIIPKNKIFHQQTEQDECLGIDEEVFNILSNMKYYIVR
ncbi:hypothetical protein [Xenorhabdus sp. PB62.4]|uniref:hypothetical protein n=1 Tax=Xenorhabdus sp. PB62.4 TaxID=1851573 RepID=UPI0016569029|nr:hypothetical protein [Xenorhabdus sp. PB62.4]MBC8953300.1 hypothetical protein [Xenorhabdus sp. PB62.4]